MTLTYQNIKYDILIDERIDSVYIEFYDKQLYKTFSNIFLDTDVITFNMSIKTFYTVMDTVIKDFIKLDIIEDDETSMLKIFMLNKQMKLYIHHKYYIEFKFEIELNLNIGNSLDDNFKCLKKFEDKIKKLEISNQLDKLQEYIDNYMQVCIGTYHYNNCSYSMIIPINIPKIKIKNDNTLGINLCKISDDDVLLSTSFSQTHTPPHISINVKFNKHLCGVKCKILELYVDNLYTNWNENTNFTYSVETLIINKYTKMYKFQLPNLINLELIDCSFELIFDLISHIKTLKNITIQRCNNFKERELLISKSYNVKMLA